MSSAQGDYGGCLSYPKVILFGDSLTQYAFGSEAGWASLIADKLQRRCDVINRGFSGYNSRWNRIILPQIVRKSTSNNIAAFVIFIGVNDSSDGEINPRQHVPVAEYEKNLVDMIEYLKSVGVAPSKVILIGPLPCDVDTWKLHCSHRGIPLAKNNDVVEQYSKACERAASTSGSHFVELFNSVMNNDGWKSFLNDGLHLSRIGSEHLFGLLWPVIESLTSSLPDYMPSWDTVDYASPEKSLLP